MAKLPMIDETPHGCGLCTQVCLFSYRASAPICIDATGGGRSGVPRCRFGFRPPRSAVSRILIEGREAHVCWLCKTHDLECCPMKNVVLTGIGG